MTLDLLSVLIISSVVVNVSGVVFIVETLLRRDDGAGRVWALGFLAAMLTTLAYVLWAQKQGIPDIPPPSGFIMAGGTQSTADLIKSTQKGILVTRLWYIRPVDPQTLLYTGLTRDGTFYIENGKIKHPVKNFRFNESPVIMLNNIEELGRPVRVSDGDASFVMMIPAMKLRDFTFTSLSDAV